MSNLRYKLFQLCFQLYYNKLETGHDKVQTYTKAYFSRFIVSMRLMNASLDTHIDNLVNKIYNQ